MSKRKNNESRLRGVLYILAGFFLLVILLYVPLVLVNSYFWKDRISPQFDGVNLTESFKSNKEGLIQDTEYINPTTYRLQLDNAQHGDIVSLHTEYDAYWYAREINGDEGGIIMSSPHKSNINVFRLRKEGDYTLEIFHAQKRWKEYVFVLAIFTLPVIVGGVLFFKLKFRKRKK